MKKYKQDLKQAVAEGRPMEVSEESEQQEEESEKNEDEVQS